MPTPEEAAEILAQQAEQEKEDLTIALREEERDGVVDFSGAALKKMNKKEKRQICRFTNELVKEIQMRGIGTGMGIGLSMDDKIQWMREKVRTTLPGCKEVKHDDIDQMIFGESITVEDVALAAVRAFVGK